MVIRADQPTFSGLEIAPELAARTDTAKYRTALKRARNVVGRVAGGVRKRQGFAFVGQVENSPTPHRLIPFQFSTGQGYALVFGDKTMEVVANGGFVVEDERLITGATNTNPVVLTIPNHGYVAGRRMVLSGFHGMVELNGVIARISAVLDADRVTLEGVDGTTYGVFTGCDGGAPGPTAPPEPPAVIIPPPPAPVEPPPPVSPASTSGSAGPLVGIIQAYADDPRPNDDPYYDTPSHAVHRSDGLDYQVP